MQYDKKISICMMIKDEEKNLHRCLKSLVPILDLGLAELIIVDTGSKDNSIEIAKKYTSKVYEHPWTNNFSEMRNISISYAKGEWIWIIDADEEVENPKEAIELLKQDLSKYNSISIKVKNYMESFKNKKEPSYNMSISLRVFRNSKEFKYEGSIHNQPKFKKPTLASNIIFRHYGYIWEDEAFKQKKFKRTAGLLRKELEKNPSNIYYQYQLAVSTAIIDKKCGLEEFRKTYKLIERVPYKQRYKYIYVYGLYSINATRNAEYKEAIKICKEGLKINRDYIDIWYSLFLSYTQISDDENILKVGKEFLACKKRFNESPVSKDPSLTFYYLDDHYKEIVLYDMALVYIKKEEYKLALKYVKKINTVDLKSKVIAKFAKEEDMHKIIIDYLKEIKDDDNKNKFIDILEVQDIKEESKKLLQKDIIKFYKENNKEDSYYLLNAIRENITEKKDIDDDIVQKITDLNYDELGDYYGDIVFYIIKNSLNLNIFQNMGDPSNLDRLTKYAITKYKDFYKDINEYLHNNGVEDICNLRYWISLARNVLVKEKLDDYDYIRLFRKYIVNGLKYINNIYNPKILEEDMMYDIYSREHKFFIYLQKANSIKESNTKEYIRYLRKALKVYPMKKGIEILLEEVKKEINITEDKNKAISEEKQEKFEEYKIIVKKNINILIEANKILEAKSLIDEYLKIIPNDLEMLTLKSEIQLQLM